MFRRQGHIRNTEDGIGSGGEHINLVIRLFHLKGYKCAFALSYPVFLHSLYLFRPAFKFFYILKQSFGIVGNFEKPLFQFPLAHLCAATFAQTVYHLFIGQYRFTGRTPIHCGFLFIGQTLFIQLQKQPLCPFIIIGMASCHFPVPIIAYTQTL